MFCLIVCLCLCVSMFCLIVCLCLCLVSGKPDHLLNVSRFVQFGSWLPEARLAAVKVIASVAASPANQAPILATFTSTNATAHAVLRAFTEALDADEDEESGTRLALLELLQTGLNMAAPSLAHFLLGFDLVKGVSRCQLQSAQVTGVRTPLHALLALLAPDQPGNLPPALATSAPSLLTAAYKLIFTLASSPQTSEPILRFLRSSSDFLSTQLATVTALLAPNTVEAQRSAAWLLRSVSVEVRLLAKARQTGSLSKLVGLLLDTSDGIGEEDPGLVGLYQDATFSQLSRTVAHTSTSQDATASVHRLAVVLNNIDFQVESLSAPTWQLFDDGQVASVLEQCQTANNGTSSQELLIEVPRLHKILAAELAAIQGSAAANQRVLIQSEIEAILVYAVQWNAVQEGSAARRELLDAWRQVTETLITVTPAELLPS